MSDLFMQEAIALAEANVRRGGGPFGALVVEGGAVLARAANRVTAQNDPTAHAEIEAIRAACAARGDFSLSGCTLYATCEPCPMCLGAIYWARLDAVVYASTRADAAAAGFDDAFIYQEIPRAPHERQVRMTQQGRAEAQRVFDAWAAHEGRIEY